MKVLFGEEEAKRSLLYRLLTQGDIRDTVRDLEKASESESVQDILLKLAF